MKRLTVITALACVSTTLACGENLGRPDEVSDFDEDSPEMPDATDELEDPGPGPELDDGADPQVPEFPSRITHVAEDDGDLIVHATLADEVGALYSGADHYQIRFTDDSVTLVEIRGVDDELYDLMRVGERESIHFPSQERTKQICFPFPTVPPVDCFAPPCEWPGGFPAGSWPDCIEINVDEASGRTSIIGAVDGVWVGKEIVQTDDSVEVYDVFDTPLGPDEEQRLVKVEVVLDDINSLLPEVEPLTPGCADCWWDQHALGLLTAGCLVSGLTCIPAYELAPDVWDCFWECG